MDADLDTLATALYVTSDDFLSDNPQHRPWRARRARSAADRRRAGYPGGAAGVARIHLRGPFLRYANTHLRGTVPYLPTQSGYNKRIRAAIGTLRAVIAHLVAGTSSVSDDVWVVDSTPVECGRSRETVKRSDLAGGQSTATAPRTRASSGGCGCTWCARCRVCRSALALTGAKADEREVLLGMLDADPNLMADNANQKLMADKNYYGKAFEAELADAEVELLRPARKGENHRRATGTSNHCGRSSSRSTTP